MQWSKHTNRNLEIVRVPDGIDCLKVEGCREKIHHAISNQKKAIGNLLISDKVNLKTKSFARDIKVNYITIKGYKRLKHERQRLIEPKREIEKFWTWRHRQSFLSNWENEQTKIIKSIDLYVISQLSEI